MICRKAAIFPGGWGDSKAYTQSDETDVPFHGYDFEEGKCDVVFSGYQDEL